jgi:hypothetical protein
MRAPALVFADGVDAVRRRHDPECESQFFAQVRQCAHLPRARAANDYSELAGSLFVAWCVASVWSRRPTLDRRYQQYAARRRDAIRLLCNENWLDRATKQDLERRDPVYAALANDPGKLLNLDWIDEYNLPSRRDHLTFADLGRERRNAGPKLFAREASAAMRAIFGKPHDKVVGGLTGLAFGTKALSPETVRAMRRETGATRPK